MVKFENMKYIQWLSMLAGILLLSNACHSIDQEDLQGTWIGQQVIEAGDTLNMDLSNLRLHFESDGSFTYVKTSRERLAGAYSISGSLLELEVKNPAPEKILIQISELSSDVLHLRMNHEGNERHLGMVKE